MKNTLPASVACVLLAAAGAASAQSSAAPAPSSAPAARESGINLKLDEADKPRPRIQFGPLPGASQGTTDAANSLPALGTTPEKPSPMGGRPGPSVRPSGAGPFPKDTNPGM